MLCSYKILRILTAKRMIVTLRVTMIVTLRVTMIVTDAPPNIAVEHRDILTSPSYKVTSPSVMLEGDVKMYL